MSDTAPGSRPARSAQRVSDATVYGDLVQIAGAGSVTIARPGGTSGPAARERCEQIIEGDVPAPPVGFQSRADLVQRLHTQVRARGAAVVSALTGTPGVGKTMLAASYLWACQAAGWPVVAWIAAETEEQILTGLDALATRLGIRADDDDVEASARRVRAWLAGADRPCLVVFDNAVDVAAVRRWCPATGALRVVITSRNRAFGRHYAAIEVEVFTPAQALAFLRERTGLTGDDGAGELAEELGCLPLALAQAAAVIAWRRIGYRAYLRSLRELPLEEHLTALEDDAYPTGAAQAVLLSLAQAEQAVPAVRELLELLAVLSPAGVARALLHAPLAGGSARREEVDDVLARLADTSLVAFTDDGQALLMHRLVQRVLRERAHHTGHLRHVLADAAGLLDLFGALIPKGAAVWGARPAVEILVEHTGAVYAVARSAGMVTSDLLTLRAWCGRYLYELADLPRAIALLGQVLADQERMLGADHPDTLTGRHNLAGAYESAGRASEAIALYEAVVADSERVLGADHPDTLTGRHNLAGACRGAGRASEAIALYEAVVADSERVLGADHPDTLTSRNNLAGAYRAAGRASEAVSLFERVVADSERVLGGDHPDTLASRNNLAHIYDTTSLGPVGVSLCEAVVADRERVLGADHPDTLTSRNNLAGVYESAGRVSEAISLYEAVLADRERVLGADHPQTLTSRNNLAHACRTVGRGREAIALYEAVLTDCERALGTDHPLTRTVRGNLGLSLWAERPWWRRLVEWAVRKV